MRYRHDIRCDHCNKFIPYSQLDENGGASRLFIPDSEVSVEEISFRCRSCTEKHGTIQSYQFPNVDNGIKL